MLRLKNIDIRSKFFFAPINTGLANEGNPTNELVRFHSLRSNKYTGINYVGNVAITASQTTNKNTLYINRSMENYSLLASEIKKGGSIPGVQIACFNSKYEPQRNWKNSTATDYLQFARHEVNSLSNSQISDVVKSFQTGIKKLSALGFEVIQLHGAHGYFLHSFLSETFNIRSDEYGKDRTLIVKEILDGIDSILKDTVIDLRISLFEDNISPTLNAYQINFIESICKIPGLDMISISNGVYNFDKKLIYPNKSYGNNFMLEVMSDIVQKHTETVWNISGNIRNLHDIRLRNSSATFAIGRPIIADHEFLTKIFEHRENEIISCNYSNQCHYFSLKKDYIACGVNKQLF